MSDDTDELSCTHDCVKNLRGFIDGCAQAVAMAGIADHLEQQIYGCGGLPPPPPPAASSAGGGGASASCDVTCVGKTFTAGSRAGDLVCSHELCGATVPFVGLDTFGCSDQKVFWGGSCCNVHTCPAK